MATSILRFRNEDNEWIDLPAIIGKTGVSIVRITRIGREGTEETGYLDTYRIDFSDNTSTTYQLQNGAKGAKGDQGEKGTIDVVTATTLNPGEEATVTKTVDTEGQITLNFGIPKGSASVTYIDWGDEE